MLIIALIAISIISIAIGAIIHNNDDKEAEVQAELLATNEVYYNLYNARLSQLNGDRVI